MPPVGTPYLTDLSKYFKNINLPENLEKCNLIDYSIQALTPFIDILNNSQVDGASWTTFYTDYCHAINKTSQRGLHKIVEIAEKRRSWVKNPIVKMDLYLNNIEEIDDQTIELLFEWTHALKIPDFKKYTADKEFNSRAVPSRKLKLFHTEKLKSIAISEASVERCFSQHKLIHTPLRASIKDDLVEDILYIRYNTKVIQNNNISDEDQLEIEKLIQFD